MAQPADGAQKLASLIKPLIEEGIKRANDHTTAQMQEVLIAVGKLEARMELLEKLVTEKKKAPRAEKKAAGDAPAATPDPAAVVAQPKEAPKAFPVNKLVYFRDLYKNNQAFRDKYTTPEIKALIDKDETIQGKAKEDQKLIAMASFVWGYIKNNQANVMEQIEKEYAEAKQAHEAANKQQQTVEAKSPEAAKPAETKK